MTAIDTPRPRGLLYRLPIIGRFARELTEDFHGNIWYFLVILLTLLVVALQTWGLPALTLAAVGATPVMFVIIVMITVGK
ncbi:hypothetical protein [Salipiger mucosus]|uniref:Uncharacterized protein n=1 Tax=Salipiger mucosus DSM 16094 TaxID=1123237 RepID=S9QUV7_9RHOB|nr:hypothetical protein [Salipiger mucosus]EPX85146.1 hypothetical protein Salmuc_01102 [Salipiger mucosus DSM 16094]